MADEMSSGGRRNAKDRDLGVGVKTERRVLRFINNATSPQQLVDGPEQRFAVHAEHRGRRHPDPHEIRDAHLVAGDLLKREEAERILAARDKLSPIYGYRNLRHILGYGKVVDEALCELYRVVDLAAELPHEFGVVFIEAIHNEFSVFGVLGEYDDRKSPSVDEDARIEMKPSLDPSTAWQRKFGDTSPTGVSRRRTRSRFLFHESPLLQLTGR